MKEKGTTGGILFRPKTQGLELLKEGEDNTCDPVAGYPPNRVFFQVRKGGREEKGDEGCCYHIFTRAGGP